jgi:hypothetical protein
MPSMVRTEMRVPAGIVILAGAFMPGVQNARIIVVGLSQVRATVRATDDHASQFNLFKSVFNRLCSVKTLRDCEIATLEEMMDLLAR